jgi:hypothetical protein
MVRGGWTLERSRRVPVKVVTVEVLQQCLDRVALLIAQSGDKGVVYLPIYERLESELSLLQSQQDRLKRICESVKHDQDATPT